MNALQLFSDTGDAPAISKCHKDVDVFLIVRKNTITIYLMNIAERGFDPKDEIIGTIDLNIVYRRNNKLTLDTHSLIHIESNKNRGYGILLYAKAFEFALNNNYRIRSTSVASDEAKRCWESKRLNKAYKISYRNGRYWLQGRREN